MAAFYFLSPEQDAGEGHISAVEREIMEKGRAAVAAGVGAAARAGYSVKLDAHAHTDKTASQLVLAHRQV